MLTIEIVSSLDDATVRTLSKSADESVRNISFQVIADRAEAKANLAKALNAEAIAYSKQTHFEFADGSLMTLSKVAMVALNTLATKAKSGVNEKTGNAWAIEETPALLAEQGEAWDVLRKVQQGKVASGEKFSLATKDLRALLG
jgi:endonuclease/exonuclease/phosphatase (EEP) superfamily protein YafD